MRRTDVILKTEGHQHWAFDSVCKVLHIEIGHHPEDLVSVKSLGISSFHHFPHRPPHYFVIVRVIAKERHRRKGNGNTMIQSRGNQGKCSTLTFSTHGDFSGIGPVKREDEIQSPLDITECATVIEIFLGVESAVNPSAVIGLEYAMVGNENEKI